MKKIIIILVSIFAVYILYDIYSGYYAQKKKEMDEILSITQNFKHVYMITSDKIEGKYRYSISSDTLRESKLLNSEQFDTYVLKVEGIKHASSKLYLNDFVKMIILEDGNLSIHFIDVTGASNINGKWVEERVGHDR